MNKIYDAYEEIHADSRLIDSTQAFLEQIRFEELSSKSEAEASGCHKTATPQKSSGHRRDLFRPAMALLTVLILLCGMVGINAYQIQAKPVSYISIDECPSIELSLNRSDKVLKATAYNDDGQKVLDQVNVTGKSYEDAIEEITEAESHLGYLNSASSLVFTVMSDDDSRSATIRNKLITCKSDQACDTSTTSASTEIYDEAHDNHMSFGKYNMYLSLSAYDSTITAQDCASMTMEELNEKLHEHEYEHAASSGSTHDQTADTSSDCADTSSGCDDASSDCSDDKAAGNCDDTGSDDCSDDYTDSCQSQCDDTAGYDDSYDDGCYDDYTEYCDSGYTESAHDASEHGESGHGGHDHH